MTQEQTDLVSYKIDSEGFDYCFRHYSDFKEIDDAEFHELRRAYVEAANRLEDFIIKHMDESPDEDEFADDSDEEPEF